MKKILTVAVFIFSTLSLTVQANELPDEVKSALLNGARVKMTVKVVDEDGMPVSNAVAGAYFRKSFGKEYGETVDKLTDEDGIVVVEERTSDIVFTHATKDGYYRGRNEYFATKGYKLDGDKWLPWDVTNTVTIRRIKKQVPMYHRVDDLNVPHDAESGMLFFDLMLGDWVKPYGNGEVTDLVATFKKIGQSKSTKRVTVEDFSFEFVGESNGFYIKKKVPNSELATEHEASLVNIYTNKMEVKKGYELLQEEEYFVFRIRSKMDEDKKIISAYYGVCSDYFYIPYLSGGLSFRYSININENERSLEYDGDFSHTRRSRKQKK